MKKLKFKLFKEEAAPASDFLAQKYVAHDMLYSLPNDVILLILTFLSPRDMQLKVGNLNRIWRSEFYLNAAAWQYLFSV